MVLRTSNFKSRVVNNIGYSINSRTVGLYHFFRHIFAAVWQAGKKMGKEYLPHIVA